MTLGQYFNQLADKVCDANLVTRTGVQTIKLANTDDFTSATLNQWFEARKVGNDTYKVFKMQEEHKCSLEGIPMFPQVLFHRVPVLEKPLQLNGQDSFTLAEAKQYLESLETYMMNHTDFQTKRKPSSIGLFNRYYK